MGNRILITGAAGYVGSPVVDQLLSQLSASGSSIEYLIAVDRTDIPPTFTSVPNAEWIQANLDEVDNSWWETNVTDKSIDTIYYLESTENINIYNPSAAQSNIFQLSDFYFVEFLQKRIIDENTEDIRILYLSTDKIYYDDDFPNEIHDVVLHSMSSDSEPVPFEREVRQDFYSYAAQKAMSEIKLYQVSNVELRIVRPFAIVGPGIYEECPINITIDDTLNDEEIQLFEGGKQGVAFTHVNDLVTLLIHENLFNNDIRLDMNSDIINFCRVQNYLSARQLTEKIINKTESNSDLFLSSGSNIYSEVMDTPQIRNMIRIYQPQITIEVILEEMIYDADPVNHYADFVVTAVTPTDVSVQIIGSAEPESTIVVYFGNGENTNHDIDTSGNFTIDYTFEYPIDIYPIEMKVTTKDYIQYASKVIQA